MKKTITVTQEHIKLGDPGNCSNCPIARAMMDAGFKNPLVGNGSYLDNNGIARNLPTPASDFITSFDMNLEVQPFTFEIELPE